MRLELSSSLHVSHRLDLRQIIATSQLMRMPIQALDTVLENIALSPEMAEGVLVEHPNNAVDSRTKAILGSLHPEESRPRDGGKDYGGIATDVGVKSLDEAVLGNPLIKITPDVIYVGRDSNKPVITYADHLVSKPTLSQVQIPSHFGNAKRLYVALVKYREWVTSKLREEYVVLGDKQREFISSLDPKDLNILTQTSLGDTLGVSPSTVSRLVAGRYVQIDNQSRKGVIVRVSDLIPSRHDFRRYHSIDAINKLLANELTTGVSLSDDEIARASNSDLARRTITKFRTAAGIPDSYTRDREYEGGRKTAYSIGLEF